VLSEAPDALIRAIAIPGGDAAALHSLQTSYLEHLGAQAAHLGDATALASRAKDPLFLAWLIARARQDARAPEQPPATSPRVLAGNRFALLEAADWPPLMDMLQNDADATTKPAGVVTVCVSAALQLLRETWPEAADDVESFVRALFVPDAPPGSFSSGSVANMPYIVRVSCHQNAWPALLADSLIHEAAHVKLRMAMQVTRLLQDDSDNAAIYTHPWRQDRRPLTGVLLATHAFVSVFAFYKRLAALRPDDGRGAQEAEALQARVETALRTLETAQGLAPAGVRLSGVLRDEFDKASAIGA
jgi:HEXXH motif-containing protein